MPWVFEQFGARRRSTNFTRGERLGVHDHVIELPKPKRPEWMSQWEYEQFPATLKVRELKAGGKILVTTFLDPKETSQTGGGSPAAPALECGTGYPQTSRRR